ncbi:MAG: hypothetical protein UT84_C0003G0065 [Candidatus Curtissbacteria bacterium GW2011_GWA1_40_16]|uniref:Uncharacterized protein n=1 Tax=Candidatus Curtissbacteria bacterium GW2011_GWA1_40_16 TaxID=1618405 RepID=A0A0G0TVG2_9BACT|nr:MAG: hypothetical protein UT84_C0003G0065 [Candidatus Curtissbacteria bacterium GW2011_GWA1_40_16]
MSERPSVEDNMLRYLVEPGEFHVGSQGWRAVIIFQYHDERFPRMERVGTCDTRDSAWDLIRRMKETIDVEAVVVNDDKSLLSGGIDK